MSDSDLAAFARALLAARDRIRKAPAADLAGRLPPAVVGQREEFEARLAAARDTALDGGRVTPEQLRKTIELIRAHQPLPATLKLPRVEEMLRLEPLRKSN